MKQNILKKVSVILMASLAVFVVCFLLFNPNNKPFLIQADGTHIPPLTFGGTGTTGGLFYNAAGVVSDSNDNIYVMDPSYNRIQKFDSSGNFLLTFGWGVQDGSAAFQICTSGCMPGISGYGSGQFNQPKGISIDSSNNIYVVDYGNYRIQKFDSSGNFLLTFGWGVQDGSAALQVCTGVCRKGITGAGSGQFYNPMGIYVDGAGNIYVADSSNYRIQKFNSSGNFLLTFGWGVQDGSAAFQICTGVCRKGITGTGSGQFSAAQGIFVDDIGNIYIADTYNSRIQKFDSSGNFLLTFGWGVQDGSAALQVCTGVCRGGISGIGIGQFSVPSGISLDSSGNIYVAESGNPRVQKFNSSGEFIMRTHSGEKLFYRPSGIFIDKSDNIYVTDMLGNLISRSFLLGDIQISSDVTYTSTVSLELATAEEYQMIICNVADFTGCTWENFASSKSWNLGEAYGNKEVYVKFRNIVGDESLVYVGTVSFQELPPSHIFTKTQFSGTTGEGKFNLPYGLNVDGSGNIYVADTDNNRIQKFDSSGGYIMQFGSYGTADGQFDAPEGVFLDSSGNIYVADSSNNRIQKFDSAGNYVTQFGEYGSAEGQFYNPSSVFVDTNGNIYVTDSFNYRIQKFDSSGNFLLTFGWGVQDGSAALQVCTSGCLKGIKGAGSGQLDYSAGMYVDGSGNIYVVDTNNSRIQKFDSAGNYVTKFGAYGSADGQLSYPSGVFVDINGNIYVADTNNNRIQKFDSSGGYIMQFGSYGTADGQFDSPSGIFLDGNSNIYVLDTYNNRIQKFDSAGQNLLLKFGELGNANAPFSYPRGITTDSSGNIYLTDSYNYRVLKLNSLGEVLISFGGEGVAESQFDDAQGISLDGNGNIYVADTYNNRIQKFDSSGNFLLTFGWGVQDGSSAFQVCTSGCQAGLDGSGNGQLDTPQGVALDSSGNIYVLDTYNDRIQKFSSSAEYITQFGSYGSAEGQFSSPEGFFIDKDDNIYVADTSNYRIQKLNLEGICQLTIGYPAQMFGDFSKPSGIVVDSIGNIYVADTWNDRIQKFSKEGDLISIWGTEGDQDGQFYYPEAVTVSSNGTIYVSDTRNDRIQAFSYSSTPVLSTDSSLSSLTVSGFTMSPTFATGTTSYTGSVDSSVGSVSFTPTTSSASATVSLNGVGITSGNTYQFNLVTGTNNVAILVTAEDGTTTTTYSIVITKAAAEDTTPPAEEPTTPPVEDTVVPDSGIDTDITTPSAKDSVTPAPDSVTPEADDPAPSDVANDTNDEPTVANDLMSVLSINIANIGKSISKIAKDVDKAVQELPISEQSSQNITAATLALVAVSPAVSVGLGSSYTIAYIARFFSMIFALFGIGRKKRNCGLVYDSVTKEPISNAIVRIYSTDGTLVATEVTNVYGIFETDIESGQYSILAQANNYRFPSMLITGTQDIPYENIYRGGTFNYDSSSSISYSIPVDPLDKSNTEYAGTIARNKLINVSSFLLNVFILVGLVFSVISYIKLNSTLNLILLLVYIFLIVLRMIMRRQEKYRFGTVTGFMGETKDGVQLGLMETEFNTIYAKRVSNEKGKYRFIVPGGDYKLVSLDSQYELEDRNNVIPSKDSNKIMVVSKNISVIRR